MMRVLSLLALILLTVNLKAQTVTEKSIYQGQLSGLRLVLRLYPDSLTGKPAAHFESPDQTTQKIPVSRLHLSGDSLVAESALINGNLKSRFSADRQTLSGTWSQHGRATPMTLKKVAKVESAARPQTPKPPFPYRSEDVTYASADKSIRFGGTLTLPSGKGPFPAVILISGSGQQDRDETLFGHKPFLVIADHLTRQGFAVLRVDDRGVGQTTGIAGTSAEQARDVLAGLAFLKTRSEINPKKLGLVGHSEGGIIGPLAAVQSKDVAFLVSLAGIGVKGLDLIKRQNYDILKASAPMSEEFLGYFNDMYAALYVETARQPLDKPDLTADLKRAMKDWQARQPESRLRQMGVAGEAGEKVVEQFAPTASQRWYRSFLQYDPAPVLSKLTIPVLALNGEKDLQVSSAENLAGFEKYLKQAGNKRFKTQSFPNLNHLFQTAKKGTIQEYGQLEETFSPQVLAVMTDWLKAAAQ